MKGIIYISICAITGIYYIGYSRETLELRKKWHEQKAPRDTKNHFHAALVKYGFNSFRWRIIDYTNDIEELKTMEQDYICMFGASIKGIGYNSTEGGDGAIHNEKTREKIRQSKLGNRNPQYGKFGEESSRYGKKFSLESRRKISYSVRLHHSLCRVPNIVKVINLDTKEIFEAIKDAADKYGVYPQNIIKCCKGERRICGRQHWAYYEDYIQGKIPKNKHIKSKNEFFNKKKVINLDTGIIYDSIAEVEKSLYISHSALSRVCSGKGKTAGGFHWAYLDKLE